MKEKFKVLTKYGTEKSIEDIDIDDLEEEDISDEENIEMNEEIDVIQEFSMNDNRILGKIKSKEFEPFLNLDFRLKAEEIAMESEIKELLCYPAVKKHLEYNLPHQPEGALKIIRDMDCRVLLADEVGLGKTITAGLVLKECITRGFVKNALILVPPSLVMQWQEELKNRLELEFFNVTDVHDWKKNNFLIASIDKVKNFNLDNNKFKHSIAHEIYWDIVIIDEAHKLKDRKTYRWKFVDNLQKKRLLLLTATPFQNDLIELYNLLYLLRRGHLGTLKEFKKDYMNKGDKRYPLNPEELKKKLGELMIRRRKDETDIDYKKRIPCIEAVKLTDVEFEAYNNVIDLLMNNFEDYKGNKINSYLSLYQILPMITSSSKASMKFLSNVILNKKYSKNTIDMAKELYNRYLNIPKDTKINILMKIINNILIAKNNSKILIYTKHPDTLKYIASVLMEKKLKIAEYYGGLTKTEKDNAKADFKNNAQIMISTDTGAEGLNFQFCNNLINYDLPWNPMSVEQRIGRLDRIGQKKNIHIYNLAIKDTMEEHVFDLIINKMCCIGLVIGELPIILFNMGLDSEEISGNMKFEERLINAFINSRNNLIKFSSGIEQIEKELENGISEYQENKQINSDLLDNEK